VLNSGPTTTPVSGVLSDTYTVTITAPLTIAIAVEDPNQLDPFYTSISKTITVTP
jgi:hypothetical protein